MIRKVVAIALLLCSAGFTQASSTLTQTSVDLGDVTIVIPATQGFVEACGVDAGLRNVFSAIVHADNELLACLVTEKDYREYQDGVGGLFTPYMIVQVAKASKRGMSRTQYERFVASFEEQLGNQFDEFWGQMAPEIDAKVLESADALGEHLNEKVTIELGSIAPIEVSREFEGFFMSVWMANGQFDIGGEIVRSTQVQTSAVLYVRKRMFNVFGYREYEGRTDVTELKEMTREWVAAFVRANGHEPRSE